MRTTLLDSKSLAITLLQGCDHNLNTTGASWWCLTQAFWQKVNKCMGNITQHNAADAIQCLVNEFNRYLDGSEIPDNENHECSRDNAIQVQETLCLVRELGAAIENGDPQDIANFWLQLKPQVELHEPAPFLEMA